MERALAQRFGYARSSTRAQALVMATWVARLASVVAEPPAHVGALVGLRRLTLPPTFERLRLRLLAHLTDSQLVAALSVVLSICAYVWYASSGATLGYGDALSRMVIARRVVAGAATGLGQLGTTWLPLHTMLMLPFIWNDTLFHTGLAGSIPSMAAYVIAAVYIYRMVLFLFPSRGTAWISALIFMLNPSVLYMQTTAMSEIPLLCTAVLAMFYMLRWAKSYQTMDLVKSACAVAASAGIRYDGWALALTLAVVVACVAWRRQGLAGAESYSILYGMLAFSTCAAWLIYNFVIFHDPILFLFFGNSSHTVYQSVSYHRPLLSLQMYGLAAGATAGWAISAISVVGLIYFIVRTHFRMETLPLYVLLVPIAYHWLIFYTGADAIFLPELGMNSYWNERFGLMLLPAIVTFAAYVAYQHVALRYLILGVTLLFSVMNMTVERPMSLREPMWPQTAERVVDQHKAAQWVIAHYKGGEILVSNQPDAPMIFYMMQGISDERLITDTPDVRFHAAVAQPQTVATWLIVDSAGIPHGSMYLALYKRHDWQKFFVLRKVFGTDAIYERIGAEQQVSSSSVPTQ